MTANITSLLAAVFKMTGNALYKCSPVQLSFQTLKYQYLLQNSIINKELYRMGLKPTSSSVTHYCLLVRHTRKWDGAVYKTIEDFICEQQQAVTSQCNHLAAKLFYTALDTFNTVSEYFFYNCICLKKPRVRLNIFSAGK